MKKTVFIKNAIILTASSLLLRFLGIIFKVWLAAKIGAEGIGLYQLVFSVYMLAATFATSGISTAVTRLVADETALGSREGTLKILRRCIELTLIIAAASVSVVFFGADFISGRLLGDMRAAPALKILSLSLPFMGISSCLRGYFIARRKAGPNAGSQIFEQAVRIILVAVLIGRFSSRGLAFCCSAVLLGDTVAEVLSCLVLWLLFLRDEKGLRLTGGRIRPPYGIVRKIMHIALPITSGRYLNTALRTGENLLVPKGLSRFNADGSALSQFGMIKGMALPVLFFPSTLLNSLSTLLIPEMSEAAARGRRGLVKNAAETVLRVTSLVGIVFGAVFFVGGERIGVLIYKSGEVGELLRVLSPIVPLMYLDSVSDGILKGLDQQRFTFRTSVCDSALRIALILPLLPRFGLTGFIWIMYFSNLLTCTLNVGRLLKVSGAVIKPVSGILLPVISALTVTLLCDAALSLMTGLSGLVYIILLCGVSLPAYGALLLAFGCVSPEDIKRLRP